MFLFRNVLLDYIHLNHTHFYIFSSFVITLIIKITNNKEILQRKGIPLKIIKKNKDSQGNPKDKRNSSKDNKENKNNKEILK